MKRDIYKQLVHWKNSPKRKPLLLRGARQVGKTYILKEFGSHEYTDIAYFNFEEDPSLKDLFTGRLVPGKIVQMLSIYREEQIVPQQTLIVLDEVQNSPEAITSLKYFCEKAPEYHVVAAGSLLGVKVGQSSPFPVGKVNFLDLYPMHFSEFLEAVGKNQLKTYVEDSGFEPISETFHKELIGLLKIYYFVGGMPEAVAQYVENQNLNEVRKIQEDILEAYAIDFSKYTTATESMRLASVWESMPRQLAQEKKRFKYSEVAKSARVREYGESIQWLVDAGLVIKVHNTHTPKLPLSAYREGSFKLYILDIGLLGAMIKVSQRTIVQGNMLFSEYNGAFTENYAAQELLAHGQKELYYWTSKSDAEVDFIIPFSDCILPFEVKAGVSRQKKSLLLYGAKYSPPILSRATLMNFKEDNFVRNYPLYAFWLFLRDNS